MVALTMVNPFQNFTMVAPTMVNPFQKFTMVAPTMVSPKFFFTMVAPTVDPTLKRKSVSGKSLKIYLLFTNA